MPQRQGAVAQAAGRMVELLEERRMLAVVAQVNFQTAPPTPPVPAGYVADVGLPYADRGNGFTYGWWYAPLVGGVPSNPQPANNPAARNRTGGTATPDIRYKTLDHFHKDAQSPGGNNESIPVWWEISVPNGLYHVHLVAGDAENHDSYYNLRAEAPKVNGIPVTTTFDVGVQMVNKDVRGFAGNAYPDTFADSGIVDVMVTDGTLTISEGPNLDPNAPLGEDPIRRINDKIDFIDITNDAGNATIPANPSNLTVTSTAASKVGLHWTDNSIDPNSETGFRIESSTNGTNFSLFGTVGKNVTDFVALGLNPQTKYFFRVYAFNLIGDSAAATNTVNTTTSAATGSIINSILTTPAGDIDLTAEGTLDWAHWGLVDANSFNHKTGASLISDVTPLPGSPKVQGMTSAQTFSWSNGTPTASTSGTPNVLGTFGFSHGYTFTAPADTTVRVLRVYVGVNNFRGQLTARLSDGSAADAVDSSLFSGTTADGVYTLAYKAASAGQTLSVTWLVFPPDGNVTDAAARIYLKAATLVPPPPAPTGVTSNLAAAPPLPTGRIKLTWDDQSTGETGYSVERAPEVSGAPGTFTQIGTTDDVNLVFFDGTTAPTTKYYYRVKAMNYAGITGPASNVVTATTVVGPYGTGAQAFYFNLPAVPPGGDNNPVLAPLWPVSSLDPTINFNWGAGAPPGAGPGFPTNNFITRWTAKIKPEYTGEYIFYADTDDGYRLYVNSIKLLDGLGVRQGLGNRFAAPPISLVAGQTYTLTFDQIEEGGDAGARLFWSSNDVPQEIVPQYALFPVSPLDTTPPKVVSLQTDGKLPATAAYTAAQHLVLQFSESIGGSLDGNDIAITADNGAVSYSGSQINVAFDSGSNSAVITINGQNPGEFITLPDGNYKIFISSADVNDGSGNLLDGDGDNVAGGDFNGTFYVLTGDTHVAYNGTPNNDRKVSFIDYQRLELGFGKGAADRVTNADGDFNHDGVVDSADVAIFFQKVNGPPLPPPAAPVEAPAPAPVAAAPAPVKAPVKPAPVKAAKPVKPAAKPIKKVLAPAPAATTFATKRVKGVSDWLTTI